MEPGRFFAIISAICWICAAGMPVICSPASSVYRETWVFRRVKTQCGSSRLFATRGLPFASSWYPQVFVSYLWCSSSYPLKTPSLKPKASSERYSAFVWVRT